MALVVPGSLIVAVKPAESAMEKLLPLTLSSVTLAPGSTDCSNCSSPDRTSPTLNASVRSSVWNMNAAAFKCRDAFPAG